MPESAADTAQVPSDGNERGSAVCPGCRGGAMRDILRIPDVPVLCTVLYDTPEQAKAAPRSTIELSFCPSCGLIYNTAFDEDLLTYTGSYENSLHFSKVFEKYTREVANRLVSRHRLRGGTIVEIGCGQGAFLAILCELAESQGFGYDPSFDPRKHSTTLPANVTILPEMYGFGEQTVAADLICSRYVFEHIPQPLGLLATVRARMLERPNSVLYFEVPNAERMLREVAAWDLIYEHCSYFTPASLRRVIEAAGFDVLDVRTGFDDQFVSVEAKVGKAGANEPAVQLDPAVEADAVRFGKAYNRKVREWSQRLEDLAADGRTAAIWGAGARGVMFLNTLQASPAMIPLAIDVNPRKRGRYLAGTGQRIVAPEDLQDHPPDVVVVMNPVYRDEISEKMSELGITADVVAA